MSQVDDDSRAATERGTGTSRKVVLYCLAIISATCAITHFAVAGAHYQEYWAFGAFMLASAWLQVLWAVAAIAAPSRLTLWAGIVLDAGVATVYVLTRTVGDIIGPTPHAVEEVGFGDGTCTILEVLAAAGCVWLLLSKMDRPVRGRTLFAASAVTGAAAAVLLSVSLIAGGPDMVMSADASDGAAMNGGTMAVAPIELATNSPAGDITMPDPMMQMEPGMAMTNQTACITTPTKDQQQAAVTLVNATWSQAGASYQSLDAAKAAGYRPITPPGRPVVHYISPSVYLATVHGGPILDTAQPQSLVYANTPKGAVLVAAMFMAPKGANPPQPGGCLTQWHVHTNLCTNRTQGVVAMADPTCPAGSTNKPTQPMLHIWFVPIPGGPTAVDAPDTQVVQAAERVATTTTNNKA